MRKCDLIPVLDNQARAVNQVVSLSGLLQFASRQQNCPLNDLCGSLSALNDLIAKVQENHTVISQFVVEFNTGEGA